MVTQTMRPNCGNNKAKDCNNYQQIVNRITCNNHANNNANENRSQWHKSCICKKYANKWEIKGNNFSQMQ